jgi:integrase
MICRVIVEFHVDSTCAPGTDLRAQVDAWIAFCRDFDGQAARHCRQQAVWVRQWLDHVGPREPTPAACVEWLRDVTRRNTLAPQTIRNRITACRRFCGWLVVQDVLKSNPWASVPAPRGRTGQGQDALTDEQVDALVAHARQQAQHGRKPTDRASAANRANLYQFLQLTGLRRGEARAQMWKDIDLQARTMIISHDKARRRDAVPLCASVCQLLSGLAKRGPKVFDRIVTDKALKADLAACGITGRYSWHSFRAGYITSQFEAGTQPELIQRLVRHRSIDQTHRYLRHKEERLRDAAERRGVKSGNFCGRETSAVDRLRTDSTMASGATTSANSSTTSASLAPTAVESTSRAGLRSVRSRSSVSRQTQQARAMREPVCASRGDRICTDTPIGMAERLLEAATLLMQQAMQLLAQQGATREQGSNDSGPGVVGEEGRGREYRHAQPRKHGRHARSDEDPAGR